MRRAVLGVLAVLLLLPALAGAHAERATFFVDHDKGHVPKRDRSRVEEVVCKPGSKRRIRRIFAGRREGQRLRLLERCRFQDIQAAVDHARSGDRIAVMPGVYRELPSRRIPVNDPKCAGDKYWEASGDNHQADGRVPTYLHQLDCPNSRNLVAVVGDSLDPDRVCDHLCHLTIEGFGKRPTDVIVRGDRRKPDVIRADRADGFQLRNLTAEQGAYNDIDLVETNGFRLEHLVARWGSHYGILTFTTDNGIYDHITAYGSGDSGVYPGSGPERHCADYGIQVRHVNAYGNVLAGSGTAGNGTWWHDNHFHDNGAGISQDSFAPGHPGMPQDCSKWTDNVIHSNNRNFFEPEHQQQCIDTPFEKRPKRMVCPAFEVVVGVGFMLYGVNDNVIAHNYIYDQHRNGIRQFHVPAALRGDYSAEHANDTSHGNHYTDNWFGVRPDGTRDRNGLDVFWDEQGLRNCWQDNHTAPGVPLTSDPATLPTCADGGSIDPVGNTAKVAQEVPCVTWNPQTNPNPAGCAWFTTPEDPGDARFAFATASEPFAGAAPAPSQPARGGLNWEGEPTLIRQPELPDDRILSGTLRNDSPTPLRLDGATAVLRDDAGRRITGIVSFAAGFTHGLYSPAYSPREPMPDFLATRLGMTAVVAPGDTVDFTVAWRGTPPSSADLGSATVALPATR
jgi:hypothetical protein